MRGKQAAFEEMKQLHDRVCFEPIDKKTLTATEAKRVLDSLIVLVEKKVDHPHLVIGGCHASKTCLAKKKPFHQFCRCT